MAKYLDESGLCYFWQKLKLLLAAKQDNLTAGTNINISGNTISTTAEVNQNAFSNVTVGGVTVSADSKTDTLELVAGTNITLTPDTANDSVTIAAATGAEPATAAPVMDGTAAVGTSLKYAREDHRHPSDTSRVPTTRTVNGKALSSNITLNASDVNALPNTTYNFGNVKVGNSTIAADSITDTLELAAGSNVTLTPDTANDKVTISATDTTYSDATTSTSGLMSAADKTKLNGIASGAEVNVQSDWDEVNSASDAYILNKPSIPGATSTTPAMDGVAAVGTETTYARGDHVHPTDTSRQETLVSGTNIKTVDGTSILGSGDITTTKVWYGTSSTAESTAAKVVSCDDFVLQTGAIIVVTFSTANTAATPTLNVNNTGAKSILIGTSTPNTTTNAFKWSNNSVLMFMYNGTSYVFLAVRAANTTLNGGGNWFGKSTTAAGTGAKTASIPTYRLVMGTIVSVLFTTANTVSGSITLNINSTGAKTVYVNNATTSVSNSLLWDANEVLTFVYDGSYYQLISRSRAITGITVDSALDSSSANPVQNSVITNALSGKVDAADIGVANGIAPLNASSKIDSTYLPSYVDDVVEAYPVGATPLASDWLSLSPGGAALTPESGKIYVLMSTDGDYLANTEYRWGATVYVQLNDSGISPITDPEIDIIMAS